MNDLIGVGLKEWAVVCEALASGRQTIVLRKGGIEESSFQAPAPRFWLVPTFVHQQEQGVAAWAESLLTEGMKRRPNEGSIMLTHWAEVAETISLPSVEAGVGLGEQRLHVLSEATLRKRWEYRQPGLSLLLVRVFRSEPVTIPDVPRYAGCKSWVEFDSPTSAVESHEVIDDVELARQWSAVRTVAGD